MDFNKDALSLLYDHSESCKVCKVLKPTEYRSETADLVRTHELVKRSGKFNFEGCLLANFDYKDTAVCDLLEFGFPIGFVGNEDCFQKCKEAWQYKNYKGAEEFPVQKNAYLRKELECKAIIGPFKSNPFSSNLLISPLNSVPKHTSGERRVILDLSSHSGGSVNDCVPKDVYLGESVTLMFPKIDDFVKLVLAKGRGALMYKKDLSRAYRQISICPSNYNLVSFVWKKHIFCDTVLTMGCRSSAQICQ
ncbi:hypothetical protein MAR_035039 [Mya arenaria]|uniref:Uncharacterized protein n=1 Tax=Mya arenaria TaxID=6604 RepID=A0ABY7EIZ2_MYAAR|nr:hypothetical protein MAR_035039 [Mya arenaria]